MFIVAVYDICVIEKEGQKRLPKIMKTFRRYLHHTQRSVFEGEISEAKFKTLKMEVGKLLDNDNDYVVFYRIDNKNNYKRETLGKDYNPASTII